MQQHLFQASAQALGFEHANGVRIFNELNFSLSGGRYGLVGPNGIGKSTLAKLLAQELKPSHGELILSHAVVYLAQNEERPQISAAEYLAELWDSPSADPAVWGPLLEQINLEQAATTLSGGEWMRVRIAKTLAQPAGLLILDEPTNNLDASARTRIHTFVQNYSESLLLISHDRALLELMDGILELSNQGLNSYGGAYSFYVQEKEKEQERDAITLERLRREKKKVEREMNEKLSSQEKRMRQGAKKAAKGGMPKILLGARKRHAENTHGKINVTEENRVDKAQTEFTQFHQGMKSTTTLRLPGLAAEVPAGKLIFSLEDFNFRFSEATHPLWRENLTYSLRGPGRWALQGANGAGKSTLIRLLMSRGQRPEGHTQGKITVGDLRIALLDQEYSLLDPEQSVLENVSADNPRELELLRNELAGFQFMKEQVLQQVGQLSGGEKLKASLAKIFLAPQAPQLLILDEPTNNLDLESLAVLEDLLLGFNGALLVVSHDAVFLKNIGIQEVCLLQS